MMCCDEAPIFCDNVFSFCCDNVLLDTEPVKASASVSTTTSSYLHSLGSLFFFFFEVAAPAGRSSSIPRGRGWWS